MATLPDMQTVEGLIHTCNDGVRYGLEVASPTSYGFYKYHLPEQFAKEFWQAQRMITIIKEVEKRLSEIREDSALDEEVHTSLCLDFEIDFKCGANPHLAFYFNFSFRIIKYLFNDV